MPKRNGTLYRMPKNKGRYWERSTKGGVACDFSIKKSDKSRRGMPPASVRFLQGRGTVKTDKMTNGAAGAQGCVNNL